MVQDYAQSQAFNKAKAEAHEILNQAQERCNFCLLRLVYQPAQSDVSIPKKA